MQNPSSTRRGFLTGKAFKSPNPVFPPGATEISMRDCTGCGSCAEVCPVGIIAIEDGVPSIDFRRGECTFCGKCAERCPERVFPPIPASSFSHVARIEDGCLALNYVDCQACRDACPTTAIRFRPRIGGPFVPALNGEECSGCGACIAACPVDAVSLISRPAEAAHA